MDFFFLLVSDLPTSSSLSGIYSNKGTGAVALPTVTDDGVIVQHDRYFFKLNCSASACNWETLEEELNLPVAGAVGMILPAEYACE